MEIPKNIPEPEEKYDQRPARALFTFKCFKCREMVVVPLNLEISGYYCPYCSEFHLTDYIKKD